MSPPSAAPASREDEQDLDPDLAGVVTDDDTPVDSLYSEKQQRLLTEPLHSSWSSPAPDGSGPRKFMATANVGVFVSAKEPPLVPDMMLSVDVSVEGPLRLQKGNKKNRSYFIWRYGKPPDVVVEVVSDDGGEELGPRFERYAAMKVPYYVVWDPDHWLGGPELRTWTLVDGRYVPTVRPMFANLGLCLVVWEGSFEDANERWLRWATLDGTVIPTGLERAAAEKRHAAAEKRHAAAEKRRAESEKQRADSEKQRADSEHERAESEKQRAESEKQRAERLLEKLKALGIDPENL